MKAIMVKTNMFVILEYIAHKQFGTSTIFSLQSHTLSRIRTVSFTI